MKCAFDHFIHITVELSGDSGELATLNELVTKWCSLKRDLTTDSGLKLISLKFPGA